MPPQNDDIDTSDISVGDMSAEEIDALLNDPEAFGGNQPRRAGKQKADESSADASEGTRDKTPQAESADVDETLDDVDKQLADLESMLSETVAEIDAKPPAEPESDGDEAAPAEFSEPPAATEEATAPTVTDADEEEIRDPVEVEALDRKGSPSKPAKPPVRSDNTAAIPEDQVTEPLLDGTGINPDDLLGAPVPPSKTWLLAARLGRAAGVILVKALVIADKPFANLSRKTKMVIGSAAIATTVVALAAWIIGSLVDLTHAQPK